VLHKRTPTVQNGEADVAHDDLLGLVQSSDGPTLKQPAKRPIAAANVNRHVSGTNMLKRQGDSRASFFFQDKKVLMYDACTT
jgi:hypothetical protein